MLDTKRTARLAAEILDNLAKLGLDPIAKQEVLLCAGQLVLIEQGRAARLMQQAMAEPAKNPVPVADEVQ